jgi:iron complex outermembrane receptor protein
MKTFSYGLEDDLKLTENLGFVIGISYDIQKAEYADGGPLRDDDEVWNVLGGLYYKFDDATKVHLSIARKSRFPTLNELYSSYIGSNWPNPNLKKEKSVNYEAGVERHLPWDSTGSFTLFYSDVKDLIDEIEINVGGTDYDYNVNIGESRFQGFEIGFKTEGIQQNTLQMHYTYLDAENRSDDRTTFRLSEIPKHQLYISDLFAMTDEISFFAKAQYNKSQWEESRNSGWVELDDYWLVDFKAIVEISKVFSTGDLSDVLSLEVGMRNIFDENYETGYGFPREGREAFCSIRGSF